jgi:glucosylglycerate phosphorylase
MSSNPIEQLLCGLYPDTDQDLIRAQLELILAEAGRNMPHAGQPTSLDASDAILITYADSLGDDAGSPLQVLTRFLRDHVHDGFSTVHLLPFYPYSSDDGFSVKDYYAVDPAVGTWEDVAALRQHYDLMFDAVFNHMSAQSDWFGRFLRGEPEFKHLFVRMPPETDLGAVVRPRQSPLLTRFPRGEGEDPAWVWTTFSADQVDFDFRHPDTLLRLLRVLLFYVRQGARFIRLDAIAYLWKEAGTTSIHLPQTHAIIQLMRAVLDQVAPHVVLITETNVPHSENISYFGDGHDEAQLVYNFTLPPLLLHTLITGDARRLTDWMAGLSTPSAETSFFNFTASHDGIGLRPIEGILSSAERDALIRHAEENGGLVSYRANADGSRSPYEINISYVDAIGGGADRETRAKRFLVSQAIMLAMKGVPGVYIHSLLGSQNAPELVQERGSNRAINRSRLRLGALEDALRQPDSLRALIFHPYLHMLRVRARIEAFRPQADQEVVDVGNSGVVALLRRAPDGRQVLLALHNITGAHQPIDTSRFGDGVMATDMLTRQRQALPSQLAPYAYGWHLIAGDASAAAG